MIFVIIAYILYGCFGYWVINPVISGETVFKSMQILGKNKRIAARISILVLWPVWIVGFAIYGCYAVLKDLFKGFLK